MNPPIHPDEIPWVELAQYLSGELPGPEAARLERWIDAAPEHREFVDQLRTVWMTSGALRQRWDAEEALGRIRRAAALPARVIRIPTFYRSRGPFRGPRPLARGVAAMVALTLGGLGLWWVLVQNHRTAPERVAMSEVTTPRGQRAMLRLPDGSQVVLGPSSTLQYAFDQSRGARTVYLNGAAYFVVSHDSIRPFAVQTAHGIAKDLGTRFAAQAYPADSALEIVVAEGQVLLSRAGDTLSQPAPASRLVLAQGDLGRVTSGGEIALKRGVPLDRYLGWTEGRLVFRDTPLGEVVVQLGRWFDLDFTLSDSALGKRHLTATFRNESAPEVLRLLAASLNVRVKQRGKAIILQSRY